MIGEIDMKVMELLSARICHDLISPISAIANGIELVTEFDDAMQGEALGLIGDSAGSASRLLQFYRAAFGSARSAEGGTLGIAEARRRTLDCLGAGRICIQWPEDTGHTLRPVDRVGLKLLMNLVLAACDVLPGDGRVNITLEPTDRGLKTEVMVEKEGLSLGEQFRDAFRGSVSPEALSPKSIVAYYCWLIARDIGGELEVIDGSVGIAITATLRWAENP